MGVELRDMEAGRHELRCLHHVHQPVAGKGGAAGRVVLQQAGRWGDGHCGGLAGVNPNSALVTFILLRTNDKN